MTLEQWEEVQLNILSEKRLRDSDDQIMLTMNRTFDKSSVLEHPFKKGPCWVPNVRTIRRYLLSVSRFVVVAFLFFTQMLTSKLPQAEFMQQKPKIVDHGSVNSISLKNVTVIGVVFYGRRSRASILNYYLQKNLLSHGGIPSEMLWSVITDDVDDLAYLDNLVNNESIS